MDSITFVVLATLLSVPTTSNTVKGSDPVSILHNDSSDTRLLLGPTARSLKRGEAYIDDVSIFFPSVQVGLTDRVSIGAGTPVLLPIAEVHPGDAVWITPKVQVFAGKKTQAAVGLVHVTALGHHGGLAYGVATHGTSDAAITVGAGLAYPRSDGAHPLALVGAEKRVSPRVKLITENYLAAGSGVTMFSGGMRFIHRRRTLDLAWLLFPGMPLYPIPIARFSFQISGPDR